jgi:hypothetical protein
VRVCLGRHGGVSTVPATAPGATRRRFGRGLRLRGVRPYCIAFYDMIWRENALRGITLPARLYWGPIGEGGRCEGGYMSFAIDLYPVEPILKRPRFQAGWG